MGKAGKWLKKLLSGKREDDNGKKIDFLSSSEILLISTANLPETPNEKRRWSFGRSSASIDISNHRSSRSLDAIATTRLVSEALLEYQTDPNHATGVPPVPRNESNQPAVTRKHSLAREIGSPDDAAATKIQALFRSFLARKALKALRGLVKIQALVRGHLVRKQTSDMVRRMNALMSIQVRARVQRIQMTEEPPLIVKRRLSHNEYSEIKDEDGIETKGALRSKKGHINQQKGETMENGLNTNYSEIISISRQEQFMLRPNSSPFTDSSTAEKNYTTASNFNHIKVPQTPSHLSQFGPSYMANTESSRAKLRSHSEPKQRPMKQKTRRTPSFGGGTVNVMLNNQKQYQSPNTKKNQQPWLIKIYRAATSSKDIECDSTSVGTNSSSSYYRTLTAYEPAVDLY